MIRRHRIDSSHGQDESSSSDDDDAFGALTAKRSAKRMKSSQKPTIDSDANTCLVQTNKDKPKDRLLLQIPSASSTKRHHVHTSRKDKMDSLLRELQTEVKPPTTHRARDRSRSGETSRQGSFVRDEELHLTTNLFVGNLGPAITEEHLLDLFGQFGELHSVKIMWPRAPEARSRDRHTGFVCFVRRGDAEDAMNAFNERDPFRSGHRLMLRWGKDVKQSNTTRILSNRNKPAVGQQVSQWKTGAQVYDPVRDIKRAIKVVVPEDPKRALFISQIASYVAKDGVQLEERIMFQKLGQERFDFLFHPTENSSTAERQHAEHVYYKWRVFSYCKGATDHCWNTDPFIMIHPNGCFWIPPPLNQDNLRSEKEAERVKQEKIQKQNEHRRLQRSCMTGRRLERLGGGKRRNNHQLTKDEIAEFHKLTRQLLCISRESICQAMAFCFEKSSAAEQISDLLEELLLEEGPGITAETRIARLYLISDILFNSQQPGIRNAFLYRDAVEKMAPKVFASLGSDGRGRLGRMTLNKLSTSVSSVLAAWTNWSVYNPVLLDELHDKYHGREFRPQPSIHVSEKCREDTNDEIGEEGNKGKLESSCQDEKVKLESSFEDANEIVSITVQSGNWKAVESDEIEHVDKAELTEQTVVFDDDVDGLPVDSDDEADGQSLQSGDHDDDGIDGMPLDDEDNVDGTSLDDDDDADGMPLEDDDIVD